jgi:hypothetical protein
MSSFSNFVIASSSPLAWEAFLLLASSI